jgi:hypothetical protein
MSAPAPRKPSTSTGFGAWFNPKPFWVRLLLISGAVAVGAAALSALSEWW